eukprot:1300933-Pyramimonas_sp.AAC.1
MHAQVSCSTSCGIVSCHGIHQKRMSRKTSKTPAAAGHSTRALALDATGAIEKEPALDGRAAMAK